MSEDKNDFDILDFAGRLGKIIEDNFKIVLGLFVAAIVGGSVWTFISSAEKQKQEKAFSDLFQVTKIYQDKKEEFAKAKAEKSQSPADKKKKDGESKKTFVEASGDLEKDYPGVVEKLNTFIANNQGKNATGEAVLTLAEIFEEYKKPEQGAEVIAQVLQSWNDKNILYYVMNMRAGDLWASGQQCEKSTKYWQVVADSQSFMADQAQLKLGVCLQELGRLDEAKIWLEKIQGQKPNSTEGFSAKRYLRYLKFKKKLGDPTTGSNKAQQESAPKEKAS